MKCIKKKFQLYHTEWLKALHILWASFISALPMTNTFLLHAGQKIETKHSQVSKVA